MTIGSNTKPVKSLQMRSVHARAPIDEFRDDVVAGLTLVRKSIPSKYLYDARGAELFEAICDAEDYYPTRTEWSIFRTFGSEIVDQIGPECCMIEFGSGASTKTRWLLENLERPAVYVPIDVSVEQLQRTSAELAQRFPKLAVLPVPGDFTQRLEMPAAVTQRSGQGRKVLFFPGSTIGNFAPFAARKLLRQAARIVGPNGFMLLGVDLKKDPKQIQAAYDDSEGVTREFTLNLLHRIRRELGADLKVDAFDFHAIYNPSKSRVEIYLVTRIAQSFEIGGRTIHLEQGESIRTEYSYKFSIPQIRRFAEACGWTTEKVWTDPRRWFSLSLLRVPA